jgi:hypothetical protein
MLLVLLLILDNISSMLQQLLLATTACQTDVITSTNSPRLADV